ncbi:MAG: outer membrane beta-barrel protein [Candidatus Latescibacteria bacterium]|nr:outer membrane beta-barrel protein [Candidatus Latescibacterota bacterium]
MNARRTLRHLSAIVLLTCLAAAAPAVAADWEGGRWLLGFDIVSSTVGANEDANDLFIEETAPGAGMQIGYLFTPNFQLRLFVAAAEHETSDPDVKILFGGGTLDAVYLFRAGQKVRPYVFGGLGGFSLESQQADLLYEAEGPGMALGGGVHVMLGRKVSLHGALRYEAINWDKVTATYDGPGGSASVTVPVDEEGTAGKVLVGIVFWL